MAQSIRGDVVVVPFPFSDLSNAKRRPALVIASLKGDDVILCQITSQKSRDEYSIQLNDADFAEGSLKLQSHIRPNRIFTADLAIILYRAGRLRLEKVDEVIGKVVEVLRG